jgi:peptidoglycan/LPS O-acetylase OafA/YrhL
VGSVANTTAYTFSGVLQTVLMQADFPGAAQGGVFSGMFWAVAVEFQLYLVFPFLHHFTERHGVRWALACIALCVAMRLLAAGVGPANARDISYSHVLGRLDQFVIGMLAARLFRSIENRQLPWGLLGLAATGFVLAVLTGFNQLRGALEDTVASGRSARLGAAAGHLHLLRRPSAGLARHTAHGDRHNQLLDLLATQCIDRSAATPLVFTAQP